MNSLPGSSTSNAANDNATELQLPGRSPNRYARSTYSDGGNENNGSSRPNYGSKPGTGSSGGTSGSASRQNRGSVEAAGDSDSEGGPISSTGGRRGPRRSRSGGGDGPFLPSGSFAPDAGLPNGSNEPGPTTPGRSGNRTNSRVAGSDGDSGGVDDGFRGSGNSGRSGLPTYGGAGSGDTGTGATGSSPRNTGREQAGNGDDNETEVSGATNAIPTRRNSKGRNPRLAGNAFDHLPSSDAGPDTKTSGRSNANAGNGGANEKGGLIGKPDVVVPEEIKDRGPQVLTVVLLVDVNARGRVTGVVVEKSSGHKAQDAEAVKACWNTRYKPRKRDGQPVATQIRVPIKIQVE